MDLMFRAAPFYESTFLIHSIEPIVLGVARMRYVYTDSLV